MKGRIIAFAQTTPALTADRKHETRRYWNDKYARTFHEGQICQAWDRLPRTGKGKRVAMIRLTTDPFRQPTSEMTEDDFEQEGFAYLTEQGIKIWDKEPRAFFEEWRKDGSEPWVINFKLAEAEASKIPGTPDAIDDLYEESEQPQVSTPETAHSADPPSKEASE